jgi:hypothetical protein
MTLADFADRVCPRCSRAGPKRHDRPVRVRDGDDGKHGDGWVPVGRLRKKAKPAARHEKLRCTGGVCPFYSTSSAQGTMGLWSVEHYMTTRFTKWKDRGALKWVLLVLSLLWFGTYFICPAWWVELLYPSHLTLTVGALVLWGYELRRGLSILRCGATLMCIAILAEITLGWGVRLLLFASLAGGTHYLARHPKLKGSPGTRCALKWLARAGCILVVAVWGLSSRWEFACAAPVGKGYINAGAFSGNLRLRWVREMRTQLRQRLPECSCRPASTGSLAPEWPQMLEFSLAAVDCVLPCWLVLVGCAIPAYVLWRWEAQSSPPGKCGKCGYDLTGNVSEICPECGTPISEVGTKEALKQQTDDGKT